MTEEKKEEEVKEAPSAPKEEEEKKEEIETPETPPSEDEDPVKDELEKVEKKKSKFTKRERLNFEKKKIDEQLGEIDVEEGIAPTVDESDDTPVTVGMLKKRDKELSARTSLDLAEEIEDEDERKLTIHYLKNNIRASGNPQEDLKIARGAVNSLKNAQIAEETERKRNPKEHGTPPGAPLKHEKVFTPTEQERVFMEEPYNLTKKEILAAREKSKRAQENK